MGRHHLICAEHCTISEVDVNGPNTHPVFTFLKGGTDVQWNFEKWLVVDGVVTQHYPEEVSLMSHCNDAHT